MRLFVCPSIPRVATMAVATAATTVDVPAMAQKASGLNVAGASDEASSVGSDARSVNDAGRGRHRWHEKRQRRRNRLGHRALQGQRWRKKRQRRRSAVATLPKKAAATALCGAMMPLEAVALPVEAATPPLSGQTHGADTPADTVARRFPASEYRFWPG
jgi:hypothetical protein